MNKQTRAVWRWPCGLAAATLFGLLSALLGDGFWDVLSWPALALPLVVCLACAARQPVVKGQDVRQATRESD